jgi:phenylalanyl-tRNA synthetase beta chain
VLAGERQAYLKRPEPIDVWDAKGLAEGLLQRLTGRAADVRTFGEKEHPSHLHPRGAATVSVSGSHVGTLGPVHPDVAERFELDPGTLVVEIDLEAVARLGALMPRFAPIPRFPASTRDLALVVPDGVLAGDVLGAVRRAAGALAEEVSLFDRFSGDPVPKAHTSLAFRVVYRAADRTLTDAEVDAQHARVVAEVGTRFGATLRA